MVESLNAAKFEELKQTGNTLLYTYKPINS